jgi:threonyl-tRNA synthetase
MHNGFDLSYKVKDYQKHYQCILHPWVLRNIEHFIGILGENTFGKFSVWLSPD